jgi:hypothetical protein
MAREAAWAHRAWEGVSECERSDGSGDQGAMAVWRCEASARAHWLDESERTCEADQQEARCCGQLGATLGRATMGWPSRSW